MNTNCKPLSRARTERSGVVSWRRKKGRQDSPVLPPRRTGRGPAAALNSIHDSHSTLSPHPLCCIHYHFADFRPHFSLLGRVSLCGRRGVARSTAGESGATVAAPALPFPAGTKIVLCAALRSTHRQGARLSSNPRVVSQLTQAKLALGVQRAVSGIILI